MLPVLLRVSSCVTCVVEGVVRCYLCCRVLPVLLRVLSGVTCVVGCYLCC